MRSITKQKPKKQEAIQKMRRLEENCKICGKVVSRFQAYKMVCTHCKEVVCRNCQVDPPYAKPHWKICRKCEGAIN